VTESGASEETDPEQAIEAEVAQKTEAEAAQKTESEGQPKDYGRYGPSAFPKHVLTEGEVPLFETRPLLWIRLMGPVLLIVFFVAVLAVASAGFGATWLLYGIGVVFLLGIAWVFLIWLQWRYTIYAATNRRVLCQTGILSKSYVDCPLGKVQTVYLDVPLFGRMNNFGTVRVATAGEAKVEIEWRSVKDPLRTQRVLNEIIQKHAV
jgi:membrane protein YdbS with pleckstrin-like domain